MCGKHRDDDCRETPKKELHGGDPGNEKADKLERLGIPEGLGALAPSMGAKRISASAKS